MNTRLTVYSPEPMLRQPARLVREAIGDLAASRGLAWQLASRDLRAQYRQTALGLMWAFMLPVAHTLLWVFLQRAGVLAVRETGMPYGVFVFTGTMLWAIFSDALTAPLRQATAAKAMLAKINFPRDALILSGVYQSLFHAGIRMLVLFGALIIVGIVPDWPMLLAPGGVLLLILAGTAVGLALVPVGLLYTDVGRALPLVMQFLMFLSPVIYPVPPRGVAATLLDWNPLTPLLASNRSLLVGAWPANVEALALVSAAALALLLLTWLIWRLSMPIVIERLSA